MSVKQISHPETEKHPAHKEIEAYKAGLKSLGMELAEIIEDITPIRTYKKGSIILREGQTPKESFYCLKGCVRQYYVIDGDERTTFFYTEGHSISSNTKIPSKHYLACVEETTVTVCTAGLENELYSRFPKLETMCRMSLEDELGNYQEMLATYITTSPEERYFNLMRDRPELLVRVPQYQLASYLGVKPESLSRIRKRILNKK